MAYSDLNGSCVRCGPDVTFRRHHPEHLLHLVISIVTGGLWLPVWLLAAMFPGPYRCRLCGSAYVKPRRSMPRLLPAFAILAVFLLVFGLTRGFSNRRVDRPSRNVAIPAAPILVEKTEMAGPVQLSAAELLAEFRESPSRAERRLGQSELVVSGTATLVEPSMIGGQYWLIFIGRDREPLAKCLLTETNVAVIAGQFGDSEQIPLTIRCRFLGYSPSGSLTLHRAELAN